MTVKELIRQLRRVPGHAEVLFVGPSSNIEVTKFALFDVPKIIETIGLSPMPIDFVVNPEPRESPPIIFLTTDIRDLD